MANIYTNPVVRLDRRQREDNGRWELLATYQDGRRCYWGNPVTERGSRAKLTQWARKLGLVVSGEGTFAAAEPPTEEPGCPDCGAHVASEGEHCPTCDPTGSAAWDRALDASEALGD